MIVTCKQFMTCLYEIDPHPEIGVDTETTGLRPYHGDEFFSVIIATKECSYYFNFLDYPDEGVKGLCRAKILHLRSMLMNRARTWYFANAVFDMAMLAKEKIHPKGHIHDLMASERLLDTETYGNMMNLGSLAPRYGGKKDQAVDEYIAKNKLWTVVEVPGKKQKVKLKHFDQVPFSLITERGAGDAELAMAIGKRQRKRIAALDKSTDEQDKSKWPKVWGVYENESRLIKTVSRMERRGALVDLAYCERARDFEVHRMASAIDAFAAETGKAYKANSQPLFKEVFASEEDKWVLGKPTKVKKVRNPSFESDVLQTFENPAAKIVLEIRDAKSKADYYHGFLYHADPAGRIHTNFSQWIPRTGRFSSSGPNLQNMTKDEDDELKQEFVVRRAIVPAEGNFLLMVDYRQQEYRLAYDYAGAKKVANEIAAGKDVHQVIADLTGLKRSQAKNVNFAILYGAGNGKLSKMIKTSEDEAARIRRRVFAEVPELEHLVAQVTATARKRGFIFNWFGRRLWYPDREFCYKAINGCIQSGGADMVKIAMNRIEWDGVLDGLETEMILQIHDELVFEGPRGEEEEAARRIQAAMEAVYPHKIIPMSTSADVSYVSLADKEEGWRA